MAHMLFVGTTAGIIRYAQQHNGMWQRGATILDEQPVLALVAVDAAVLLANVGGESYASFDGGESWQPSSSAPPSPIGAQVATAKGPQPLANPRLAGATAYARLALKPAILLGAGAGGMMLFRSDDDGIHWEPARMREMVGRITTLIPAADKAQAAWAGTDQGVLLRSNDVGANWHVVDRCPAAVHCVVAI